MLKVYLWLVVFIAVAMLATGCNSPHPKGTVRHSMRQRVLTIADLRMAAQNSPLRKPDFEPQGQKEQPIEVLSQEYLVGTWVNNTRMYSKHWSLDANGHKVNNVLLRCRVEQTVDFSKDGTFTEKVRVTGFLPIGEKEKWTTPSVFTGRWTYSSEDGTITQVYESDAIDRKVNERRVVWLSENTICFRVKGKTFDTEKGMKMTYDEYGWQHVFHEHDVANDMWLTQLLNTPDHYTRISAPPIIAKTSYKMISCSKEQGSDFAYKFVIELEGSPSNPIQAFRSIQKDFRKALLNDYADSYAGANRSDLRVGFPEYDWKGGHIEGRAVILAIQPVRMKYDSTTRTGLMAVRFGVGQYKDAREWIRQNIETLARDKNIALTTGEIPPAAKFYLGREELKDGNILEIEFKTE